jgi:hypothetical protein
MRHSNRKGLIRKLSQKHTQVREPSLHSISTNFFFKLAAISVIEIDFFSSFVALQTRSRVLLVIHTADRASKIASHSEFTLQNAWEK